MTQVPLLQTITTELQLRRRSKPILLQGGTEWAKSLTWAVARQMELPLRQLNHFAIPDECAGIVEAFQLPGPALVFFDTIRDTDWMRADQSRWLRTLLEQIHFCRNELLVFVAAPANLALPPQLIDRCRVFTPDAS